MNNKIALNEIPATNIYEGYFWWSNENKPCVFKNEPLPESLPGSNDNPFVVEGQLWDSANNLSYSIRFVDGQYLVYRFDLAAIDKMPGIESIKKEYLPNRFDSVAMLCFKEYWLPGEDKHCEDMEVLKPAMVVFTGFKY